jgi:hypothetical protein
MPVAVNTAMLAASRRAGNDLPWQALFSSGSSPLVKTGTAVTVTFGARSRAIGSGDSSSPARYHDPLIIGVAALAALWTVSALAVFGGAKLLARIPGLKPHVALDSPCGSNAGHQLTTRTLVKNGAGDVFGIITTPDGIVAVDDGTNALELFRS